ncbi:capsular exopolysaccharide family [Lishizhenia tianjinensis]|uniref:non-specific protein-tyrosine kinase n=1 Tax=Lishizhenia tianjinensis TaxID=477690 RepID=A0A1I7BM74_9FLAO|nr:polysaccharide biosynthesis tyrosine autokinase [Lishizhenia tianjinensis]SFT88304.1 capsular exopolysaccharide family [Lishizhenia tianjinensis]
MNSSKNRFFVNTEFDLDIIRNVLKKNFLFALLIIAFFGALSFLYLRYTKPVYQSQMVIQIDNEDQGANVLDLKNVNNDGNISKEIELLRSQFLFEEALKRLNLEVSHFAKGEFLTEERYTQSQFQVQLFKLNEPDLYNLPIYFYKDNSNQYKIKYNYKGKEYIEEVFLNQAHKNEFFHIFIKSENEEVLKRDINDNELYFVFNNTQSLMARLHGDLTIAPLDVKAKSILISYRSNNAHLSQDICNAVGESFFDYDDHLQQESSEKILKFINAQLDSLNKELILSRNALTEFQRRENLSDLENIESNLSAKVNTLENELEKLKIEHQDLKRIKTEINNSPRSTEVYKLLPVLIEKSYQNALKDQIETLFSKLEQRENLLYTVTEESRTITQLDKKISADIEITNKIINALEEKTAERIDFLENEVKEARSQFFSIPDKKMELSRLKNKQDLNEKYYTSLNEKKVAYAISNAGYTSENKVLSKALLNSTPVEPNKFQIYYTYFILGILLALLFLFFKYVSYDELNNLGDLEKLAQNQMNILGSIPFQNSDSPHSQLVVHNNPKSYLSEAFRGIRSNLKFINPEAKTIAISSSISGEGKTFVALNLSAILAMSGKRVVILDLDLRKPKVHLGVSLDNKLGVSDFLSQNCTLEECINKDVIPNLDVITAGSIPPNPSELILSKYLTELIENLKTKYDYVLIDNPPVGIVSDGVQLLHDADIPIYIFKANYSKRQFIKRVLELKEIQKIKSINLLLNGVEQRNSKYGYGYGYGYGYTADQKKNRRFKK